MIPTLLNQLANKYENSRLASLYWILIIDKKVKEGLHSYFDQIFFPLIKTLADSSENVSRVALQVLARLSYDKESTETVCQGEIQAEKEEQVSVNQTKWNKLVTHLILLFSSDRSLLLQRGSLIIRQICSFVDPQKIYTTMAKILVKEKVCLFF